MDRSRKSVAGSILLQHWCVNDHDVVYTYSRLLRLALCLSICQQLLTLAEVRYSTIILLICSHSDISIVKLSRESICQLNLNTRILLHIITYQICTMHCSIDIWSIQWWNAFHKWSDSITQVRYDLVNYSCYFWTGTIHQQLQPSHSSIAASMSPNGGFGLSIQQIDIDTYMADVGHVFYCIILFVWSSSHWSTSAKCKSVRKPQANLPDTPTDLTRAPKWFQMLPGRPRAKQSDLGLCKSILRCSWEQLLLWRSIQDATRCDI